MPSAHRISDKRFCKGETIDTGLNATVYVNLDAQGEPLLWAVEGEQLEHKDSSNIVGGELISVYGKRNIFIEGKRAIVVGDRAQKDYRRGDATKKQIHPFPPTDPQTGSPDVICYNNELAGDIKRT